MDPYIITNIIQDDRQAIDICGPRIFKKLSLLDSVLVVEDDVVINTTIHEHFATFEFGAIIFRGNLTFTNTFSEDDVYVIVLGEFRCPKIIQHQDYGLFFFRKAVVDDYAILRSSNGFLEIESLKAARLFVAACVYPQISEIVSNITIFNALAEKVAIKN